MNTKIKIVKPNRILEYKTGTAIKDIRTLRALMVEELADAKKYELQHVRDKRYYDVIDDLDAQHTCNYIIDLIDGKI